MAVDDHDLDTVVACFAPDGTFTRLGTTVRGHDDLRAFYGSMMDRYVTTLHTPESHVAVVDVDAGTATGVVNGHGELALGDKLLLAAYRYDDRYVRLDDRWVFEARTIRFMYNVPFEQMATSFADRNRLRVPGHPRRRRATTPRPSPPGPPPASAFSGKRHLSGGRLLRPEKGTCGRRKCAAAGSARLAA